MFEGNINLSGTKLDVIHRIQAILVDKGKTIHLTLHDIFKVCVCVCVCSRVQAHACLVIQSSPILCNLMDPARFLCAWDSPGKNTGVGCHSLV